MSMDFSQINVWAVLVAAVASFMIGGVWYGAVFAKPWVALNRHSEDDIKAMQKKQGRNFGIFFVGDVIMAAVIAVLVANIGISSAVGGLVLGLLLWLGIRATISASKNAANNKPMGAFLIDTGHELACLAVMGVIIGAWR